MCDEGWFGLWWLINSINESFLILLKGLLLPLNGDWPWLLFATAVFLFACAFKFKFKPNSLILSSWVDSSLSKVSLKFYYWLLPKFLLIVSFFGVDDLGLSLTECPFETSELMCDGFLFLFYRRCLSSSTKLSPFSLNLLLLVPEYAALTVLVLNDYLFRVYIIGWGQ